MIFISSAHTDFSVGTWDLAEAWCSQPVVRLMPAWLGFFYLSQGQWLCWRPGCSLKKKKILQLWGIFKICYTDSVLCVVVYHLPKLNVSFLPEFSEVLSSSCRCAIEISWNPLNLLCQIQLITMATHKTYSFSPRSEYKLPGRCVCITLSVY